MSIIYNNTEIENITYNGNNIDTVNYNNTEVYVSTRTLTVNIGDYITSIIINGTTYTSNTTVSIKPGTSVTLNCNVNSNSTSNGLTTTYSFVNWTGYTTNSNKSFTFTMPNSNITYTANGKIESQTINWPYSGDIPEATFLLAINNSIYDSSIVSRRVILTEGSSTHNWRIIRANTDSYDLWYEGSIGTAHWQGSTNYRRWTWNSSTNTTLIRGLCTSYKSKLSSIQDKLKIGLNADCSDDTVAILSAGQLGYDSNANAYDTNKTIPYFNSNSRRKIGSRYWTSSGYTGNSNDLWYINSDGTFGTGTYSVNWTVVPAIRVG